MLKSLKDAQLLTAVVALESWRRGKLNYMGQTTSFCPPPSQYVGGEMQEGRISTQTFEEVYYIGANINGH